MDLFTLSPLSEAIPRRLSYFSRLEPGHNPPTVSPIWPIHAFAFAGVLTTTYLTYKMLAVYS